MSLPDVSDIRHRIEGLTDKEVQMLLKTVTLFGLRIGEACGYRYPSETKSQPTGMLLWASQADWQPNMMNYNEVFVLQSIALMDNGKEPSREDISKIREQAFVLSIITEKREGFNRKAAIPLNEHYEHWAPEVFKYITERQDKGPLPHLQKLTDELGNRQNEKRLSILETMQTKEGESILENYEPVFPFKRQEILPIAVAQFQGYTYPIAQYKRRKLDEYGNFVWTEKDGKRIYQYEAIPEHQKRFGDHALRHLRSTELKTFFLIEGASLDNFMGWSKPRGGESSAMQDRYVLEPWRAAGYFPKLLRRRA